MKSGWEYVDENGVHEKLAPKTLAENVLMTETGPSLLDAIRDMIHPVGSVWISVENTDPNLVFGGTWVRIENRFLLAAGSDFSAGETGGEKNHQLNTSELPKVVGKIIAGSGPEGETAAGYGAFRDAYGVFSTSGVRQYARATDAASQSWPSGSTQNGIYSVDMNFGNNIPHNNMPPYLAVYVWKRTA